jgi:hypothetical protein
VDEPVDKMGTTMCTIARPLWTTRGLLVDDLWTTYPNLWTKYNVVTTRCRGEP